MKYLLPPVIILGMHRSGTTLISRMLERLGLFVGHHKPYESEASIFVCLNNWLLEQCGGTWDNPEPMRKLWGNEAVRSAVEEYLRFALRSRRVVSYLGVRRYIRYRSVFGIGEPWGWKDPRNTYTLRLWLDIFPDAKVIYVRRHGIDVAHSLRVRTIQRLERLKRHCSRRGLRIVIKRNIGTGRGLPSTLRCYSLEGAFSLWEEYCDEGRRQLQGLSDQAVEVRFEELLANPTRTIASVARFCDVSFGKCELAEVASQLQPERAYAYRQDHELCSFGDQMSSRLRNHGY